MSTRWTGAAAAGWIARPDIADDPSRWLPTGVAAEVGERGAVAFFIHPTTYLERDRWNALIDDRASQSRAELFVRSQASAFNNVAEIWAPRYRQAAFGAFLLNNSDATKALGLAYGDVLAAFDQFIATSPADRPSFWRAHSQVSLHLTRLRANGSLASHWRNGSSPPTSSAGRFRPRPTCRRWPALTAAPPIRRGWLELSELREPANRSMITDV